MINPQQIDELIAYTRRHETPWPRDSASASWGIHMNDRPPWNRLLGPVHDAVRCPG